jgi:hypothetical protein
MLHNKVRLVALGFLVLTLFGPAKAFMNQELYFDQDYGRGSRESVGLARDPDVFRDASVQIYAARLVDWTGAFAVHTWTAVKRAGEDQYTTIEMDDDPDKPDVTENFLLIRKRPPDQKWFGSHPILLGELSGDDAEAAIDNIMKTLESYPYRDTYRAWPGPNSNTLTATLLRSDPRLTVTLPAAAIGKDYPVGSWMRVENDQSKGCQASLFGLLGFELGSSGFELHVLGLTYGADFKSFSIKLPGFI